MSDDAAPQDQARACYAWERALGLPHEDIGIVYVRKPFSPDFLKFYHDAWRYAVERFQPTDFGRPWWDASKPPPLKFSARMTRTAGMMTFVRHEGADPLGIKLGFSGLRRSVVLHEIAHVLTISGRHGSRFCRVVLDLYMHHFGIDETLAIELARVHGVEIASPAATP